VLGFDTVFVTSVVQLYLVKICVTTLFLHISVMC